MVVGSEVGPCPNLFDAENVTSMPLDERQAEASTSVEHSHMISGSWQAFMLMLTLA